MTVNFNGNRGFRELHDKIIENARGAPKTGDLIAVNPGESLIAPPAGKLWYSPSGVSNIYQLHDLVRRPILEVGDTFGIRPGDARPLPPGGTILERIPNPPGPEGELAAELYKVIPPMLAAAFGLPKPKLPPLKAFAIDRLPVPLPGQRWQPAYVDGRNLQNVYGALVAA